MIDKDEQDNENKGAFIDSCVKKYQNKNFLHIKNLLFNSLKLFFGSRKGTTNLYTNNILPDPTLSTIANCLAVCIH